MIKPGRSITAAPDKIFPQTFFEGIDKGWNCGLVGVSITSGNRKCPKNRKLTEKQCGRPDAVIFLFSQICRIQTKNVGIISKMMRSIWFWIQISIIATKNEKNDIFFHFRLPEMIKTSTKPQFQPLSMPSKKVWANILSKAAVIERPDFIIEKENSS